MKFLHFREFAKSRISATGGVTIGYETDATSTKYTWSLCCRKDNYNKKIGRSIVQGRYEFGHSETTAKGQAFIDEMKERFYPLVLTSKKGKK
jgi:hypothetical protein